MKVRTPLTAACVLAGLAAFGAPATAAEPAIFLFPGAVAGEVRPFDARPGDTVATIAASHGVHPIRVTKPSAKALKDGLQPGETVFIDQRRIVPTFGADARGIVVDLPGAHLYLLEAGRIQADWPVGVSTGEDDWKAPIGPTKVVEKVKDPTWHIPAKIQAERARKGLPPKTKVEAGPKNPLGRRWIGIADGTYGIHGTLDPTSIKRYASHGCVRMNNADVEALFDRVEKGTPVRITYQPVKLAVDRKSVWLQVFPDFYHQGYDYRAAVKALAAKANVQGRLDGPAVEKALAAKDGLLVDVGQPLAPPSPLVRTSPGLSPGPDASPAASP
jgi:L,D-transpeptidase ErfK/SrfK